MQFTQREGPPLNADTLEEMVKKFIAVHTTTTKVTEQPNYIQLVSTCPKNL